MEGKGLGLLNPAKQHLQEIIFPFSNRAFWQKKKYTFLSKQIDSSLQESWLMTVDWLQREVSCQMQAKRDEVSTTFLIEGVKAHASITFSVAFTSNSAMDFWEKKLKLEQIL